jgi:hypothetical protein
LQYHPPIHYSLTALILSSMRRQSTFVRPSIPAVPEWTKLSPLDQFENRFIVPIVLVFQTTTSPAHRQSLLQDIETSLANLTGEMPFVAADVVPDCTEQETIQLEVSDDAGVWFHSQELPDIDYHELERRGFPPSALPLLSVMPEPRVHSNERSPVLTVLATFISGGLLLTLNCHHSVMDGSGMATLAKTLAKHVAALSNGRHLSSKDAFPEDALDRSSVFDGSGRKRICDSSNYRLTETFRSAMERHMIKALVSGDRSKPESLPDLELSYWTISAESISALRQAAMPPSKDLPVLTANAIICAVLWRHISRARQLSSRGITTSSAINSVNVRRRMEPPLPLEYPGNAVVHAKTSAATADVESAEPGMLYKLAKQIADAIDWWSPERIRELIGSIQSSEVITKIEPDMNNFQGPDVEVTNTSSLGGVMNDDWGCVLGKLKAFRYANLAVKDGWVNVLPQRGDTGAELSIGLEKSTARRLKQDKEWLDIATELC